MPAARPALRRFIDAFRDATSHPLALWLSTELAEESGGVVPDPWPVLVADLEAEGNALIGARTCPVPHGPEDSRGRIAAASLYPCPSCGAAL
jgi:hypothetical protein